MVGNSIIGNFHPTVRHGILSAQKAGFIGTSWWFGDYMK